MLGVQLSAPPGLAPLEQPDVGRHRLRLQKTRIATIGCQEIPTNGEAVATHIG